MLRSDSRIIQSGGNGVCQLDISIGILQQIRTHAMQYSRLSQSHGAGMFSGLNSKARCFYADQFHLRLINKIGKHSDGIGTAAHTCHNHIRILSFCFHVLTLCLPADHTLKLFHHLRIRIRSYRRSDNIERILRCFSPGTDGFVCRVF